MLGICLFVVSTLIVGQVPSLSLVVQAAGPWYVATTGNDNNNCLSPTTACRTIQATINKASAGDTIHIAAGIYSENITITKPLSLVGAGSTATGNAAGRVFYISTSAVEISGMKITDGLADSGGGLYVSTGNVTLKDSQVLMNSASGSGGGIFNGGTLTLIRVTISDNIAGQDGGGIASNTLGLVTIDQSTIVRNRSSGGGGGIDHYGGMLQVIDSTIAGNIANLVGGGIDAVVGQVTISHSYITDNQADEGGGIRNSNGTLTVTQSMLSGNIANVQGGGVVGVTTVADSVISNNHAQFRGGGVLDADSILNSEISNNTAGSGGGIAGGGMIVNTTISSNRAEDDGGGIHIFTTLINSTISGNTANRGGGIWNPAQPGTWVMLNGRVSDNRATSRGGGLYACGGAIWATAIEDNAAFGESGLGGGIYDCGYLDLIGNSLLNNTATLGGGGIQTIGAVYTTSVHLNCISGNSDTSVSGLLNSASLNWWGHTSGPYDSRSNPDGKGDSVTPGVIYDPFLPQPPFACSLQPPPVSKPLPVPGSVDLSVLYIEPVQVLLTNTVPLIAEKPTLVRVHVSAAGALPVSHVTARLVVENAQGKHVVDRIYGNAFITADTVPDSNNLDGTLNFLPDPAWLKGSVTITAEVDPFNIIEESDENNNVRDDIPRTFQSARTLKIRYVPIHYDPLFCNWSDKDPDISRIKTAYEWAQKIYPIAEIEYLPWPTMTWRDPLRMDACQDEADLKAEEALNASLTRRWFLQWLWPFGSHADYVFGWLPDEATGGGLADPNWPDWQGTGVAAHGDDDPIHGQSIFAHEIGHLLDRRHTKGASDPRPSCANLDITQYNDWPYATAKIQEYGVEISSTIRLHNPLETYDYMSYCWYWHDLPAWTSPHTFKQIYAQKLVAQINAPEAMTLSAPQPYFIASGLVFTDDTATLDPIWVITSTVAPVTPAVGTQYCLEAQEASGAALISHCFDLTFVNYETGETTNVDGFNLILPYPSSVARIVLKKGSHVLVVRQVSANAPVVTVLSPDGGETWAASGTYTITWSASDSDGDSLTYSVLYSSDGNNWVPLETAITETQQIANAAELAGGNGAKVMVLASDGINTSTDESNAPFTVGRKGPQAFVLSPEDGDTFLAGKPLLLQGYAYDLEDGTLGEAALGWSSDLDGDLGVGSQVLANLSLGQHIITLTATDSDGNTVTATINIAVEEFVGYRAYLPVILRNR